MRIADVLLSFFAVSAAASCALPAYVFDDDPPLAGGGGSATGGVGGGGGQGATGSGGQAGDGGMGGAEPLGPFGPPVKIISLATSPGKEDDPSFTADGLQLYFNRDDTEIWRSTRRDPGDVWEPPVLVDELDQLGDPLDHPVISGDGLTLWLSRNVGAGPDIYVSNRANPDDSWPEPELVPELSSNSTDAPCSIAEDGNTFILQSARNGGVGNDDLWIAFRADTAAPWTPTNLTALNTNDSDVSGWLSPDAATLYFGSDRENRLAIFTTTTADKYQTVSEPVRLTDLDAPNTEQTDPWLSPDERYIVFVRIEGVNADLWEARR